MRKRCTRQHFIELLSYNHVERQCLLARCVWQRYITDFGIDGQIRSFDEEGRIEGEKIEVQVKATDNIGRFQRRKNVLYYDISIRDLDYWFELRDMVILVLYDAKLDVAYFVDVPASLKNEKHRLKKMNKFVRVYIPVENVFDPTAVKLLRKIKNEKK